MKNKLVLLFSFILCSCNLTQIQKFKVSNYYYAWGEFKEIAEEKYLVRERLHIAEFRDNINQLCYISVPLSYHENYVKVKYTGKEVIYNVEFASYNATLKKSNNGWVFVEGGN